MTGKTIKLRRQLRALDHPWVILFAAINVALIWTIALQIASSAAPHSRPARNVETQPIILIATALPSAPTVDAHAIAATNDPASEASALSRAIIVYASPDSAQPLGAVEPGRHYGFVARSGDAWVQLDIEQTGRAWVKSADLIGMPDLADVATPTSAPEPRIVVGNAPAAPEQRYQVEAAPTPATCYHSERQAMVYGVSVGVGIGDSCVSQQAADQQAAESAFAQMNAALQGGR